MLQRALLEAAGPHGAGSALSTGALALLRSADGLPQLLTHVQQGQQHHTACSISSERTAAPDKSLHSGASGDATSSTSSTGGVAAGLPHGVSGVARRLRATLLPPGADPHACQQRGIATSSAAAYKFKSNLSAPNHPKLATRDNFERLRESGRDVRVASELLREHDGGRGGGRRGGARHRRHGDDPDSQVAAALRDAVMGCANLQELQVVLREAGRDLDAFLLCAAASRLRKLMVATPAAASRTPLLRRVCGTLVSLLPDRVPEATIPSIAAALGGLAAATGAGPGVVALDAPLLHVLAARLSAPSPRGNAAVVEADAETLGRLMLSAARLMATQGVRQDALARQQQQAQQEQQEQAEGGDVAGAWGQVWGVLRGSAEARLLRALGEEPPGAAAAPVGGEDGPTVDDSLQQAALKDICGALARAADPHPGTWTAAARLAARHAPELAPPVAAAVLRSYALAGGRALDGGQEGLPGAVWGALGHRLADLEAQPLCDLTLATAKLAAADWAAAASSGAGAGAGPAGVGEYGEMLAQLSEALAPRLPSVGCAEAAMVATALAQAHGARAAAAGAAAGTPAARAGAPLPHAFGPLPRLLADLLLLRGPAGFGERGFASVALALGLMGHADARFWGRVAAVTAGEVPRMEASTLSRLAGAFAAAADAAAAAEPAGAAAAAAAAQAVLPGAEWVAAAHARVRELLAKGDGGRGGVPPRDALHLLRCMAEWPQPEGGAATLEGLAAALTAAGGGGPEVLAAASAAAKERLAAALRGAGLGELPVVAALGSAAGR